MILDFNFNFKNFDGSDLNHAGKTLANLLAGLNKGNSYKLYDWAQKVYNNEKLEIDKTDSEILEALIEASEFLTVLGKVQLLDVIKKSKQ